MKKRLVLPLLILLILGIIATILIFKNSGTSTISGRYSDFQIEDTSAISKIFLADKNNNTVLLNKAASGQWTVNNDHKASSQSVDMLLRTFRDIEVKDPVAKAAVKNVVSLLATSSIKVEIYQKAFRIDLFDWIKWWPYEKLAMTYFVGTSTKDNLGTYMLMDGSDTPYITYIPGFNGFLNSRYSVFEKDWRDHSIFSLRYKDVKSVTLTYPTEPQESFHAEKKGQRDFSLSKLQDGTSVSTYDTLKLMDFFASFEDVRYETLVNDMDKSERDSISSLNPLVLLELEDNSGNVSVLKAFRKKAIEGEIDMEGNPVEWDRDRLWAIINEGQDFVMIQYYVFDPIFRPLNWFFLNDQEIKE